jgi:hypothetical protein
MARPATSVPALGEMWINSESNSADIFTKNTDTKTFEKHAATLVE